MWALATTNQTYSNGDFYRLFVSILKLLKVEKFGRSENLPAFSDGLWSVVDRLVVQYDCMVPAAFLCKTAKLHVSPLINEIVIEGNVIQVPA